MWWIGYLEDVQPEVFPSFFHTDYLPYPGAYVRRLRAALFRTIPLASRCVRPRSTRMVSRLQNDELPTINCTSLATPLLDNPGIARRSRELFDHSLGLFGLLNYVPGVLGRSRTLLQVDRTIPIVRSSQWGTTIFGHHSDYGRVAIKRLGRPVSEPDIVVRSLVLHWQSMLDGLDFSAK